MYDLVLVIVVSPCCRGSDVNPLFICSSVKLFNVGLRASLCPRARLLLLVLEVALHDRAVILFLRGIQVTLLLSRLFL